MLTWWAGGVVAGLGTALPVHLVWGVVVVREVGVACFGPRVGVVVP